MRDAALCLTLICGVSQLSACESEELIGRYPAGSSASAAGAGGSSNEIPSSMYRGRELFAESFEDTAYSDREWFDVDEGGVITDTAAALGRYSFECRILSGAETCADGRPGRRLFEPQRAVFVSYQVRYGDGFVRADELYLLTTEDRPVIGPASTHFVAFVGSSQGTAEFTFTDNASINPNCVGLETGETLGCAGGGLEDFDFSQDHSVNGCNGVFSNPDSWSCTVDSITPSGYSNYRSWLSSEAPPRDSDTWHSVELYLRLNSIENGVAMPDGEFRLWFDSRPVIGVEGALLRAGHYPDMLINQLLLVPWVESGIAQAQVLYIDDLRVAVGVEP